MSKVIAGGGDGSFEFTHSPKKEAYICSPEGAVTFRWAGPKGFGLFTFIPAQNRVECEAEYMTKAFIKKRLCEMVDRSELR